MSGNKIILSWLDLIQSVESCRSNWSIARERNSVDVYSAIVPAQCFSTCLKITIYSAQTVYNHIIISLNHGERERGGGA